MYGINVRENWRGN